jgi:hypothetical protein
MSGHTQMRIVNTARAPAYKAPTASSAREAAGPLIPVKAVASGMREASYAVVLLNHLAVNSIIASLPFATER